MKYSTRVKAFILSVMLSGATVVNAMYSNKMKTPDMEKVLSKYGGYYLPTKNRSIKLEPGASEADMSVWDVREGSNQQVPDKIVVKCLKKSDSSDLSFAKEKKITEIFSKFLPGETSRRVVVPKAFVSDDFNLVVTKYYKNLDAPELRNFINFDSNKNPRSTEQKFRTLKAILKEIIDVVNYLDEKGILHGDLHFENLIFTINDKYELEVRGFDFDNSCLKSDYKINKAGLEKASMEDLYQLVGGMSELTEHSRPCFTGDAEKAKIKNLREIFGNIRNTIEEVIGKIDLNTKTSHRKTILTLLSDVINSIDGYLIFTSNVENTLNEIRADFSLKEMVWIKY